MQSTEGPTASVVSPIPVPVEYGIHLHCENCINVATCQDSTCPIVLCDCGHKLHECKLEDHSLLCRETDFKVSGFSVSNSVRARGRESSHYERPPAAMDTLVFQEAAIVSGEWEAGGAGELSNASYAKAGGARVIFSRLRHPGLRQLPVFLRSR